MACTAKWGVVAVLLASPAAAQPVDVAPSSATCARSQTQDAVRTAIDPLVLDVHLLDSAMCAEANYHRCLVGLEPVLEAKPLAALAARLAWDHLENGWRLTEGETGESPVDTGALGFSAFSASHRGWAPWLSIEQGAVRDSTLSGCGYTDALGLPVSAHTYADFARLWMEGAVEGGGFRAALLAPQARVLGTGTGYDSVGDCSVLYVVQVVAG